jgi:cytochrome oxidase Cu insertion factor (SCO1/SenC/PrrC family)
MHRIAIMVAATVLMTACGPSGPPQVKLDAPGKKAPDFSMADLSGDGVTLSDLRGSVVILNFWDTG